MKLLVIVLCLLSERFLIHNISFQRFSWFADYVQSLQKHFGTHSFFAKPWVFLVGILFPILLLVSLVYLVLSQFLFGFMGLILSIAIFYYCLGPQNAFYPITDSSTEKNKENNVGSYFSAVNSQLFAVLFWFVVAGPIAALAYRLITLSQAIEPVQHQATQVADILEWIPARITALLYMLAGNFQRGISTYTKLFISSPDMNDKLLSECGLLAVRVNDKDEVPMPVAESLVEYALIIVLVLIALFTLQAWM